MSESDTDENEIVIVEELDDGATLEIENRAHDPPSEYTVHIDLDDRPEECSCPHHRFRRAFCKHMEAAEAHLEEEQ